MALTHPIRGGVADETEKPHESLLHALARNCQWMLRALCVLWLVATVIFMAVFWYLAIPTVILLLLTYVLLIITDNIEANTEGPHADTPVAETHVGPGAPVVDAVETRRRARDQAVERRLTRIAIEVLCGAVLLAGALGVILFGWELLPVALLVLVGYIILVTAPVWLAWMEGDMMEELEKE